MSDLDEFLEAVDETCINSIGLSRIVADNPQDAQIAMVLTTEVDFNGATMIATGSVGNDQSYLTLAVRAFQDGLSADLDVMTVGDEVIITMKNKR